jgi:hypothetical protein
MTTLKVMDINILSLEFSIQHHNSFIYYHCRSVESYLLDSAGGNFQAGKFFESVGVFIGVFSGSFFLGFMMGLVTALVSLTIQKQCIRLHSLSIPWGRGAGDFFSHQQFF